MKNHRKRYIIFHPAIAPYRIDFFNELHDRLGAKIILYRDNLKDQEFDKENITNRFHFKPSYFTHSLKISGRDFYIGHLRLLNYYKPDVVIAGEYGEGLWSAILYKKLINKTCKVYSICDDSRDMVIKSKGIRRISRDHAQKHIDGLILCNNSAAKLYRKHYGTDPFVFPIIQNPESFYKDREEAAALAGQYLQEYSLIGRKLFLFVGRLSPEKNIEYLIRSFVHAHEKHPDNRLIIIGGDNKGESGYGDRLKQMVTEAGAEEYIQFTGRKEGTELKAWMYLGQCLVLPSYHEPFGAVVGEALLAGEYVMVSDKAGAAELVSPLNNKDGNGIVIDIDRPNIDFDEITDKLKPLNTNWKPAQNRLNIDFSEYMDKMVKWIQ